MDLFQVKLNLDDLPKDLLDWGKKIGELLIKDEDTLYHLPLWGYRNSILIDMYYKHYIPEQVYHFLVRDKIYD